MSEIKAGDLVMTVRPRTCCPAYSKLGRIGRVMALHAETRFCPDCLRPRPAGTVFAMIEGSNGGGVDVSRLKKIDPPALPESVTEELTA